MLAQGNPACTVIENAFTNFVLRGSEPRHSAPTEASICTLRSARAVTDREVAVRVYTAVRGSDSPKNPRIRSPCFHFRDASGMGSFGHGIAVSPQHDALPVTVKTRRSKQDEECEAFRSQASF